MDIVERYAHAYPGVFTDLDDKARIRVVSMLGTTADGSLWPQEDVSDLVDRVSGRITFMEYLARGRDSQTR